RRALDTTITGPITNTNASLVAPQFSGETNIQPRTRLTPLPNQFASTFEKNSPRFDSESLPNVQLADAIERARAATVRLRVFDGRGYGAGTGTIIDTHGDEALVLTCGHLFRDGTKDDKIEVDLFVAGDVITVTGQLIDFDAGDRDIGLVAIRPGVMIQPVAVIADGEKPRTGESVFSFGCDRGDDPSRHDTRVTGVNKYNQNIGASNIEIEGAPIDGRSGGGLFDQRGVLIGVCNAADYKSDVGIYTGPGSIHWQLDRVRLSHLYRNGPKDAIAQAQTSMPQTEISLAAAPIKQPFEAMSAPSSREMIVIFRDPSGSQRDEVVTLRSPDEALMRQIKTAALR
ncbi:MAG: serine protease, partial [Planctomycetota bacterium]